MTTNILIGTVAVLVVGFGHQSTVYARGMGQQASPQAVSAPAPPQDTVRPDPFPIEITAALDAKKLKVGDGVSGVLERDTQQDGVVIAPSGAIIRGHVTEVKLSSRDDPSSRLQVTFDKIVLKDGRELRLRVPTIIQALAPDKNELSKKAVSLPGGSTIASVDAAPTGSLEPAIPGQSRASGARVLSSNARGVIYMKDLALEGGPGGTVIISKHKDIKLDYGTQMLLGIAPLK